MKKPEEKTAEPQPTTPATTPPTEPPKAEKVEEAPTESPGQLVEKMDSANSLKIIDPVERLRHTIASVMNAQFRKEGGLRDDALRIIERAANVYNIIKR